MELEFQIEEPSVLLVVKVIAYEREKNTFEPIFKVIIIHISINFISHGLNRCSKQRLKNAVQYCTEEENSKAL